MNATYGYQADSGLLIVCRITEVPGANAVLEAKAVLERSEAESWQ